MSFNCQNIKHICVINAKNVSKPSWSMVSYKSFWFTKLGLVCSPGLAVSKIFNNFLSLLIPSIDTEQTHCCRHYVTWINVANQITIWGFLLMTYNWLVIAVTSPIWFTKLGLICSPGFTAKKFWFNNFLSLLIPIDTEQMHCCQRYVMWINVANQITIWGFLLMTYSWLVIAVRFMIQGREKDFSQPWTWYKLS